MARNTTRNIYNPAFPTPKSVSVPGSPVNFIVQGAVSTSADLPLVANNFETWLVTGTGDLWMFNAGQWGSIGPMGPGSSPLAPQSSMHENKLTYKGISSTIVSEHNIAELFFRQHDLTREDMALFKMMYPAEFKEFREQWAKKWAIERAKDEFDEWENDPYEKKRR